MHTGRGRNPQSAIVGVKMLRAGYYVASTDAGRSCLEMIGRGANWCSMLILVGKKEQRLEKDSQ